MFKKIFNLCYCKESLAQSKAELISLQENLNTWNTKSQTIQSLFDFTLPDYIIDEIIQNEDSKSFVNLHYLINCAVVNNRISENNAMKLKRMYSF